MPISSLPKKQLAKHLLWVVPVRLSFGIRFLAGGPARRYRHAVDARGQFSPLVAFSISRAVTKQKRSLIGKYPDDARAAFECLIEPLGGVEKFSPQARAGEFLTGLNR
jgi:hypothetical protein